MFLYGTILFSNLFSRRPRLMRTFVVFSMLRQRLFRVTLRLFMICRRLLNFIMFRTSNLFVARKDLRRSKVHAFRMSILGFLINCYRAGWFHFVNGRLNISVHMPCLIASLYGYFIDRHIISANRFGSFDMLVCRILGFGC